MEEPGHDWVCLGSQSASLYNIHWPIAEVLNPGGGGSSAECQEASEHLGFCAKCRDVCTCLQKGDHSFHQIFKAIRNPKPLRVTSLRIFSFFLFLLTDTDADTPLPRTKSS